MAVGLIMAVVALSATWVFADARRWGVRRGLVPGFFDMGAAGWSASVVLLWAVALPLYLRRRPALRDAAERASGPVVPEPDGRRWRRWACAWVVYSSVMFGAALLASWNPPNLGDAPYCMVWDLSGGGWGSFRIWPFGPTCTFLYQHPVRTFEPGALWSAAFFYWIGSGVLLLVAGIRTQATSGLADPAGLGE